MASPQPLDPEQEAQAQELVARLRSQVDADLLALARLLVSKPDAELFGDTEFEARAIVHRLGAKAYSAHLVGKKKATKAPESPARTASKAPSSTATAAKKP